MPPDQRSLRQLHTRWRRSADLALRDALARLRPCRTGNYWWGPGGSIYDPETPYSPAVHANAGRETRRQRKSRRRWHDMADLKREHEMRQERAAVAAAEEGDTYCCDVCKTLSTMEVVALTDEAPCDWRIIDPPGNSHQPEEDR